MNKLVEYKSIYAPYFRGFVEMKQAIGYDVLRIQRIFLEFDRFFISINATDIIITQEIISRWRESGTCVNNNESTIYTKYSVWAQFCRYMCNLGNQCYIPRLPKLVRYRFTPYIFTHKQIEEIFLACDSLRISDRGGSMSTVLFIMPAVIRLLYGTGLRVSEALSLKNEDVDFKNHCILVKKTKNGQQRLAPLSDSLQKVLEIYVVNRNKMPIKKLDNPESYFFVTPNGLFCHTSRVYDWFRRVLLKCEIPHLGKGPRVHDLRHTFAVHSLMKLAESSEDLYYVMPILSTYLGHKSVWATEQYVRLTEEMYPDLLGKQNAVSAYVFPKINEENEND